MGLWRRICPASESTFRTLSMTMSTRKAPGWDAVVELYFDDWSSMEAAWASPQGAASDADLPAFADLTRTTWSVVDAITMLEYQGAGVKTRK